MILTEYDEKETMELFKRDFFNDGQNALSDAIEKLNSGITPETLIASGIPKETIELAQQCIQSTLAAGKAVQ